MSVGVVLTKANIDTEIANFQIQQNNLDDKATDMWNVLEGTADATLTSLGYSAGDITLLRSIYRDYYHFMQVRKGLWYVAPGATAGSGVPTANDGTHFGYNFTVFASQAGGLIQH